MPRYAYVLGDEAAKRGRYFCAIECNTRIPSPALNACVGAHVQIRPLQHSDVRPYGRNPLLLRCYVGRAYAKTVTKPHARSSWTYSLP